MKDIKLLEMVLDIADRDEDILIEEIMQVYADVFYEVPESVEISEEGIFITCDGETNELSNTLLKQAVKSYQESVIE